MRKKLLSMVMAGTLALHLQHAEAAVPEKQKNPLILPK